MQSHLEIKPEVSQRLALLLSNASEDHIERHVVGAVIMRNNKILCLKRAGSDFMPGIYELPSGKVDKDETLLKALVREIKEESNLDVTSVEMVLDHFDYRSRSGILTRQFNFHVVCHTDGRVMLHEKEHEGYVWLAQHEINNYNITTEVKNIINKAFIAQSPAPSAALLTSHSSILAKPAANTVAGKKRTADSVQEKVVDASTQTTVEDSPTSAPKAQRYETRSSSPKL